MHTHSEIDWPGVQDEAVSLLQDLLRLDTTNPPGNETAAIEYINALLQDLGLKPTVVSGAPGRPSLVVRIPGCGKRPSLMLDSHVDVVPANPSEWKVHPFSGDIKDGCIWGRGALDMKHMTAMSLTIVRTIVRHKIPLQGDLVVTATADEEGGANLGAFHLADNHPDLVRADYAIGEVGGMNYTINGTRLYPVQVAEKGVCWLRLKVTGPGGHGSMPKHDAVPFRLSKLLERLAGLRFPNSPHPAALAFLDAMARLSPLPDRAVLQAIRKGIATDVLIDRVIPYNKRGGLRAINSHTCQPTVVRCGDKVNVIPTTGEVQVDCRMLPGTSPEEMTRLVEKAVGNLATVEFMNGHRGHATPMDNPLLSQIVRTMKVMDPEGVVSPYLMPGFTNGGAWSGLGIKYVGFTPVMLPPTMDFPSLFHAPDERIPVDGFRWGVRTLFDVVHGFLS
jgi:acetylornithine deacetylase/succinyl-diaminopimelate desuccinylase-like protein